MAENDNDVLLGWEIAGPDEDGFLWLQSADTMINLGPDEQARNKLADWLARTDFE